MARLFNAYVIVDWSAAAKPTTGTDSVWIGVMKRDVRFRMAFEAFNPPTRAEAETRLASILDDLKKRGERVLVGFDFPLGFPRGFAATLSLKGAEPWRAAWDLLAKMVKEKPDNSNNRFLVGAELNRRLTGTAFPFWGCPAKFVQTTLQSTKTRPHEDGDLPELRHAEVRAKGASPIWKLAYPGSVGSQALLGMPAVRRLKLARGEAVKVWPFETGLTALTEADLEGVEAVVAEVYPSLLKPAKVAGEDYDLTQVRTLAHHFSDLDEAGKLAAAFGPGAGATDEMVAEAQTEEGWVLGV